ncbi:TPA: 30S ribosomal protein S3 [Candidatus Delongbacteria bacterium]|nr:30S ribosomal protein S3 [Candidatus Delongbacteria bacterium]
MGHKCNPIGLRLGINRTWNSIWFDQKDFAAKLMEDLKIKKYVNTRLKEAAISEIRIERKPKEINLSIHTAKPGIVIGRKGAEIEKLKEELKTVFKKQINLNIFEVKRPETNAYLIGDSIARQLEKRINFRRALKKSIDLAMKANVQGIKIQCSGRLGGADMARTEGYHKGRVPLHTLRSDIDYAWVEAHTPYGRIGVKVWVCNGEKYGYLNNAEMK